MDIISIRPPLIYGPNVKGNLKLLVKLLQKSIPLPFKNIRSNHRSFVSVFNLVDFLYHLTVSSNSIAGPLVVSDGHDLSTFELVHQLSLPLNCQPNLFSFSRRLSSSLCVFPNLMISIIVCTNPLGLIHPILSELWIGSPLFSS